MNVVLIPTAKSILRCHVADKKNPANPQSVLFVSQQRFLKEDLCVAFLSKDRAKPGVLTTVR